MTPSVGRGGSPGIYLKRVSLAQALCHLAGDALAGMRQSNARQRPGTLVEGGFSLRHGYIGGVPRPFTALGVLLWPATGVLEPGEQVSPLPLGLRNLRLARSVDWCHDVLDRL